MKNQQNIDARKIFGPSRYVMKDTFGNPHEFPAWPTQAYLENKKGGHVELHLVFSTDPEASVAEPVKLEERDLCQSAEKKARRPF